MFVILGAVFLVFVLPMLIRQLWLPVVLTVALAFALTRFGYNFNDLAHLLGMP